MASHAAQKMFELGSPIQPLEFVPTAAPVRLNFSLFPLLAQKAAASHVLMTAAELLCAEWPGDGDKAAGRSHAQLDTR
jgi:hypothetical protein